MPFPLWASKPYPTHITGNHNEQFSALQHSQASEYEAPDRTSELGTQELISEYLQDNCKKLEVIPHVVKQIHELLALEQACIVSFGSGSCVMEYLLALSLGKGFKMLATDYDKFLVKQASCLLRAQNFIAAEYDMIREDILNLSGLSLDISSRKIAKIGLFIGSAYILSDEEFIRFFASLRALGFSCIFDFHAGFFGQEYELQYYKQKLSCLQSSVINREPVSADRFAFLPPPPPFKDSSGQAWAHKKHGYGRFGREITSLYARSGWHVASLSTVANYQFVATLRAEA